MNNQVTNEIRELSVDELEAVSGGATFSIGPVTIMAGEKDVGIAFGISVRGVGGFAVLGDGGVCGQLGNPKGGGVGGCAHPPA